MNNLNDTNLDLEDVNKQTDTNLDLSISNNNKTTTNIDISNNDNLDYSNFDSGENIDDIVTKDNVETSIGITNEEKQLRQESLDKYNKEQEEKVSELGSGIRWGDMFAQNNLAFQTVREVDFLQERLNTFSEPDQEWMDNTDIVEEAKEYGITDPEMVEELINYSNNQEMFDVKIDQLVKVKEANERLDIEQNGDWYKTIGSYLIDPFVLAAESKAFSLASKIIKVKNYGIAASAGLNTAITAPIYATEEYIKNEFNYVNDSTEIYMSAILGGFMNGAAAGIIRRNKLIQESIVKNNSKSSFNRIDRQYVEDIDNIKTERELIDEDIFKKANIEKIDDNTLEVIRKNKKEVEAKTNTFKNETKNKFYKSKSYVNIKNTIIKYKKIVKEACGKLL